MVLLSRLKSFYNSTTSSIAFYPMLYAIGAIMFGLLMNIGERAGMSDYLQEHVPTLVVNDLDTARNLITTLIAGGVSMLVFSFSMVMLLLSQAASNYSPRVLPNLISERRHQMVLGIFLATIIYNIIIMIAIEPKGDEYQLPGFSVLIGVVLAVISLGVFVYFIHSISTSIQINHIMSDIYTLSRKRILHLIHKQQDSHIELDNTDWHTYRTQQSGTIQNISHEGIIQFAQKHDLQIDILLNKGFYAIYGTPLLKTSKPLEDESVEELLKNFNYIEAELVSDNYVLGFKQLTEIGIKAMSPGINDPATALDAINYLTDLFALRLKKTDYEYVLEDGDLVILCATVKFKDLMHSVLAPFRNYAKHDFTVVYRLITMLKTLRDKEMVHDYYRNTIDQQLELIAHDAEQAIENPVDLKIIRGLMA